ncbi:MAG: DNA methyltransferase, partial [Alphaproteobacteria bacterium]|nr:DNA methyltransferase [Alphaproteobacteria bacterium]
RGLGALAGVRVKQAATERVFGFEIMPAPFVVAHLQVGLTMQDLDAALAGDGTERAGIFLTNALTGWEPTDREKQLVAFPELEEERDRADRVKRERPVLVIIGNPPYNGFAGMAVEEERALSTAYRTVKRVRKPEGQGLNDLYVRFFRMAERRIAEKTGRGVVCFISNYSWLDGLSFTGMREHYLEAFDAIRIDCLNGDKYKTGKVAPDGSPDPSIFSTESDPVGIQVGTAITTLVRRAEHTPAEAVEFRHLWGRAKRTELLETAEAAPESLYEAIEPVLPLGLPFVRTAVSSNWFDWPSLPDLFPVSFPGVKTSRDGFLVDTDLDRLQTRITDYFDPAWSHDDIARRYPGAMKSTARFDARAVRDELLKRGGPDEDGFIRFAYRPFDNRWLYWEKDTKLLDEKRADYRPHVFSGNRWFVTQQRPRRDWSSPQVISHIGCIDLMDRSATCIPTWLLDGGIGNDITGSRRPNLSATAQRYLDRLGLGVEDLFHHVLAVLHDPAYRTANAGALRMEWPHIPLWDWPDGKAEGAAGELAQSAVRGRKLSALLDPEAPAPGVTQAPLRPEIAAIAVPATASGGNMAGGDFALTAGWGHYGQGDVVMPGQGHAVERDYTADEHAAMGGVLPAPGGTTFDIHLNGEAFWRNVPATVWTFRLGGYQVLKKWLSYREGDILGRPLNAEEVQHFSDTARRIAAILMQATVKREAAI